MADAALMVTVMVTRELKKWSPGSDTAGPPDEVLTETHPIRMLKTEAERLKGAQHGAH